MPAGKGSRHNWRAGERGPLRVCTRGSRARRLDSPEHHTDSLAERKIGETVENRRNDALAFAEPAVRAVGRGVAI